MDMNNVGLYILLCVKVFLFVKAQVTFNPDPAEDVQLQAAVLTPPVQVITVNCYEPTSEPIFKIQYVPPENFEAVFDLDAGTNSTEIKGIAVPGNKCESGLHQYRVILNNLRFKADPILVGGTFRLKVTLNNNAESSTFSNRTYSFPAPFNLTGSSVAAVRDFEFTWTCHVTSDYPVIEWFRGSTNLGQIGVLPNDTCVTFDHDDSYIYNCQQSALTYTLTIPGASMTAELQESIWRCRDVTTEVKGSIFMELNIFYPPIVSLNLQNITENTVNYTIRCTAVGKPNNAMIVTLEQRIGLIVIRNITSFTESSPGNITLTIPRVSYQDMGTYTCLASNGIPDRSNQKIQSDTAYLSVNTSAKFEMMQYTVRSDINTRAVVNIPFYRNPPATESDVVWTKNTGSSNEPLGASTNFSFSLSETDVQQIFYGVDVKLKGQSAIMTITSYQNYYEGNYTLKIRSSPEESAEVDIVILRSGPPDTPSGFHVLISKVSSVVLTWNKGSDGGHPQTFVILYKEETSEVYRYVRIEYTSTNINLSHEIKSLQPDTSYVFHLYSFNEKGNSTGYQTLEERTLKAPAVYSPSSQNNSVVGGAVGGVVAVLLVVIVVLVVVVRRRQINGQEDDFKNKGMSAAPSRQNDEEDVVGRKYENVDGAIQNTAHINGSKDKKKAKDKGQRDNQNIYQNQDGSFYTDLYFDRPTNDEEERTGYTMLQFGKQHTYSNIDSVDRAEGGL